MTERIGLFFYVHGEFLFHSCSLEDAENYGDFLIYPKSHMEIWERYYAETYGVDFDFFPRGRVAYRKSNQTFVVYYDRCIEEEMREFIDMHYEGDVSLGYDEHYQCHKCNRDYVI